MNRSAGGKPHRRFDGAWATRSARWATCRRIVATASLCVLACAGTGAFADEPRAAFRPCVDPGNLPFSNDKGEGFENRIAELFARKLGVPVKAYAFPQRMNFIRNTLRYRLPGEEFRCDVVMSLPAGFEQAATTPPYYRSTYVLVYPKGKGLDDVRSGSDLLALPADRRGKLRIGIHDKSPASAWVAKHGLESQSAVYPMLSPDPDQYPGQIIDKELAQGKIDAAIVWGPIGGYYAKRVSGVALVVIPLASEPGVKFDYAIAMGVRHGEREWKETVEKLIAESGPEIATILRQYGVPLLDERGKPID